MEAEANFNVLIRYKTKRIGSHVEQGHGYHEMGNYDEVDTKKVIIETDGEEIDITKYLPESILNDIANQIEID